MKQKKLNKKKKEWTTAAAKKKDDEENMIFFVFGFYWCCLALADQRQDQWSMMIDNKHRYVQQNKKQNINDVVASEVLLSSKIDDKRTSFGDLTFILYYLFL